MTHINSHNISVLSTGRWAWLLGMIGIFGAAMLAFSPVGAAVAIAIIGGSVVVAAIIAAARQTFAAPKTTPVIEPAHLHPVPKMKRRRPAVPRRRVATNHPQMTRGGLYWA